MNVGAVDVDVVKVVGAVSDGIKRGRKARPQAELERCWQGKCARGV